MWSTAREIGAGDTVIIWLTREVLQPLVITPGKELNGRFGVYSHADLVGVPYGSKVGSRNGKGFIHVLRPTPELWTLALPHRTQILYLADISFVVAWLGIAPGSRVIEAGTGSGSFSHSVTRTIGPSGHLYSYEFHEARANKARDEFARHGMSDNVTLTHRNVCKDGFTVIDTVDAVFLDLPAPWEAVQHAKKALRKDRATRMCCFSPCMEQVLRTVSALNEAGFTDITMYETLLRPHEVHQKPALQPIGAISAKLQRAEAKRENKRLRQIASAQRIRENKGKRKRDKADGGTVAGEGLDAEDADGSLKKMKTEVEADEAIIVDEDSGAASSTGNIDIACPEAPPDDGPDAPTTTPGDADEGPSAGTEDLVPPVKVSLSKVMYEVRGHTSYLTFAVLLPAIYPTSNLPPQSTGSIITDGVAAPETASGPSGQPAASAVVSLDIVTQE